MTQKPNDSSVKKILRVWTDEILPPAPFISCKQLRSLPLTEELQIKFNECAEDVLKSEFQKIFLNPLFDFSQDKDSGLKLNLQRVLTDRLNLPLKKIEEVLENFILNRIKKWRKTPLNFDQLFKDPEVLANEIFQRTMQVLPQSSEAVKLNIGLISEVCLLSGMTDIAKALEVEGELGVKNLYKDDFLLLLKRLESLRQAFQAPSRPIAPKPVAEESLLSVTVPEHTALASEQIKPVAKVDKEALKAGKELQPEIESKTGIRIPPPSPPSRLKAPALKLKLMEKQHQEYFSAKFFQGDVNSYYALVKKICAETDLKSALIAADNELFLLDVPTSSEPASRLLNIVRDSFEQQGNI